MKLENTARSNLTLRESVETALMIRLRKNEPRRQTICSGFVPNHVDVTTYRALASKLGVSTPEDVDRVTISIHRRTIFPPKHEAIQNGLDGKLWSGFTDRNYVVVYLTFGTRGTAKLCQSKTDDESEGEKECVSVDLYPLHDDPFVQGGGK